MLKKYYISFSIVAISIFFYSNLYAQRNQTFEIKNGNFYHNGKSIQIISGEMHYPRIPHEYWRHRMKMLKAMGINTISTYVFWNIHEPEPDQWDFSGDKNIAEYIKTADEEGLMVILRPGPYVCAEWEFGGYPWWLQNIKGIELRRDNSQFLERTKIYLNRLYQEVGNLQITKGGPIIMIQVENEFGAYVTDRPDIALSEHERYNAKLKKQLQEVGFNCPFYTSDWKFKGGTTLGALPTANGITDISKLKDSINLYNNNQGPYMVAEFYPGWLAHWNEPHPYKSPSDIARQVDKYLKNNISFNFYMVHGGTNFAFTSGANYDQKHDIQPDLTSYDYDAPITEAGWITPKYDSIRAVISDISRESLPDIPASIPVMEIPQIKLSKTIDVLSFLKKQDYIQAKDPLSFEQLNQGYGYVLYSYQNKKQIQGEIKINGLRDYALLYVNGKLVGELNRYDKKYSLTITLPKNSTLDILIENMGRINYGAEITNNTKGIISPVMFNNKRLSGLWKMYKLPLSVVPDSNQIQQEDIYDIANSDLKNKPAFYSGSFDLLTTGDTFINMKNCGKGIVFINGKNIGRYWNNGPQQTLYIPGVWLKKGENQIFIFEQQNNTKIEILKTQKDPILNELH